VSGRWNCVMLYLAWTYGRHPTSVLRSAYRPSLIQFGGGGGSSGRDGGRSSSHAPRTTAVITTSGGGFWPLS
jgi:hypothetical protein